ncbi:sine oculis-binding protein homolog A-like isoform X2 [Ptychodera flava]|uniref:sine oculis-binding protein homolog A-like isoform X2 n=1 Tax=Ptychodera flava TaxID=63121 RepID=UPI00396A0E27
MEKSDEATVASEEESSVEVKEEPTDEMRDFAENTMNELLGWYGYDKVDETDTQGLRLNHFAKTMQETLGQFPENEGVTSEASSTEQHSSRHKEKSSLDLKSGRHGHHSREKPTTSPLRPIAPSVPAVVPIVGVYAGNQRQPTLVQGNTLTVLRNSIENRGQSSKESLSVSDGQLPEKQIVCAWCQQFGMKRYTLNTSSESKAFCSEKCFAACRRAYFKRNKVCDWCKHVRHTKEYLDYGSKDRRLQFCSVKCLNQYKMDIFCKETQATLPQGSPLGVVESPQVAVPTSPIDVTRGLTVVNGSPQIITPESWTKSPNHEKQKLLLNSGGISVSSVTPSPGCEILSVSSPSDRTHRTETVIQSGQVFTHTSPRKRHGPRNKLNSTTHTHRNAAPVYPDQPPLALPGSGGQHPPQQHIIVTTPPGVPQHQPPPPPLPQGIPPQNFPRSPHPSVFPFPPHAVPLPQAMPQFRQRFPFFPQVEGSQINIPPATLMVPYPVLFPVPIPIPIPIPIFKMPESHKDDGNARDSVATLESKESGDEDNAPELEECLSVMETTESEPETERSVTRANSATKSSDSETHSSSRKRKLKCLEIHEDSANEKRVLTESKDTGEERENAPSNKDDATQHDSDKSEQHIPGTREVSQILELSATSVTTETQAGLVSSGQAEKCELPAANGEKQQCLSQATSDETECFTSATSVETNKCSASATSVETEKCSSSAPSVYTEKCSPAAMSDEEDKSAGHIVNDPNSKLDTESTETSVADDSLKKGKNHIDHSSNGVVKEKAGDSSDRVKERLEIERTEKAQESKRVNSEHAYAASPIEEPTKESPHTREKSQTPTPTNTTHKVVSDHAYALRRSGRLASEHHSVGVTAKAERASNQDAEPPVKRRSLRSRSKVH